MPEETESTACETREADYESTSDLKRRIERQLLARIADYSGVGAAIEPLSELVNAYKIFRDAIRF